MAGNKVPVSLFYVIINYLVQIQHLLATKLFRHMLHSLSTKGVSKTYELLSRCTHKVNAYLFNKNVPTFSEHVFYSHALIGNISCLRLTIISLRSGPQRSESLNTLGLVEHYTLRRDLIKERSYPTGSDTHPAAAYLGSAAVCPQPPLLIRCVRDLRFTVQPLRVAPIVSWPYRGLMWRGVGGGGVCS